VIECAVWLRSHTWVVGVLVSSQHDYYTQLGVVFQVVSAVVATALWPLILLGASLHRAQF
jgi:hypothetical protein